MKLAAIDLGSNSFRLEIARVEGERIITEGSWKETIRLAAGIDKDGNLTPEAQDGTECPGPHCGKDPRAAEKPYPCGRHSNA